MNGPVAVAAGAAETSVTFDAPARRNPVWSRTVFSYVIGSDAAASGPVDVSLRLYDVRGGVVKTLRSARQAAGQYRVEWNATDERGHPVAPGVYYMRLHAGALTRTQPVAVLR